MFRRLLSFASFALLASAARYPSYGTLQTTNSSGVLNVVINNTFSSVNLFDEHVMSDLANLIETLQANDTDIHVVVFSSGNKDFFLDHFDVNYFFPGYASPLPIFDGGIPTMLFPVAILWNITQLPQATIAVIEGRARGVGNEFLMSCDMRFASTSPSVLLGQLETSFGSNPGAGGAMYLAQQIGRGRTFEYVLSSTDVDALTAEYIGWINCAFDTADALHAYVDALAKRIALFPLAGIAGTKQGINAASRPGLDVIVQDAQDVILRLEARPEVLAFTEKFLAATNNQSIGPVELNYGEEVPKLYN
ncbi:ClpP/crotonase-like domain-containing protein [Mycena albidolilacea]|uniref:ClpP/crotonase-like domain-containing protein n=1 Tax=Mycena albidolilacea TaxID=1033008 RepID=A0AAD7EB12_9AGAR|nr:ClpP/crotonase-like domain-containing protein [Mycena albidolilacea]